MLDENLLTWHQPSALGFEKQAARKVLIIMGLRKASLRLGCQTYVNPGHISPY